MPADEAEKAESELVLYGYLKYPKNLNIQLLFPI